MYKFASTNQQAFVIIDNIFCIKLIPDSIVRNI